MESPTTKQHLLVVLTRKCSCLKTPVGSRVLFEAPEGNKQGGWCGAQSSLGHRECTAVPCPGVLLVVHRPG